MTNILPLTMRREYTDIVFFWKCLYGNGDVDVNDFVSFFSDDGCSTRNSIDSGFLMVPPLWRTDCFKRSFFNRIVPMWNFLPSNIHHITNYSSFISSLRHLMFEKKGILVLSVVTDVHGFLNVCVVTAGCHNHIIKGWWKFKNMLGGSYLQRLQWILFSFFPRCTFTFLYSSDIITSYHVPHV